MLILFGLYMLIKIQKLWKAGIEAIKGVWVVLKEEEAIRLLIGFSGFAIVWMYSLPLENIERDIIWMIIGLFNIIEFANSAHERHSKAITGRKKDEPLTKEKENPLVGDSLDIYSAATFINVLVNGGIILRIFWRYLF